MIKQEQWKEAQRQLSSFIKLSLGAKNLLVQKSLLKNAFRLDLRPDQAEPSERRGNFYLVFSKTKALFQLKNDS